MSRVVWTEAIVTVLGGDARRRVKGGENKAERMVEVKEDDHRPY